MQCGLKSQLAYINIYMCVTSVTLGNAIKSHVLLLCLYVPYTCYYYNCNGTLPAPGATRGTKHVFKMAS